MFPKSKKRFQDQEEMKLMSEISRFLVGIGIYPKYTGYNYIVMAVSHVVSLDGARTTLGDIYRHIGELMGKTPGLWNAASVSSSKRAFARATYCT